MGAGGGQVLIQRIDRRPVEIEPGRLDPLHHALEVRPQRARLVQGGQVAERGEGRARQQQDEQRPQRNARDQDGAPAAAAMAAAGWRPNRGGTVGHVAGTAMTTNRGAVG